MERMKNPDKIIVSNNPTGIHTQSVASTWDGETWGGYGVGATQVGYKEGYSRRYIGSTTILSSLVVIRESLVLRLFFLLIVHLYYHYVLSVLKRKLEGLELKNQYARVYAHYACTRVYVRACTYVYGE